VIDTKNTCLAEHSGAHVEVAERLIMRRYANLMLIIRLKILHDQ
jgi:hypothetical protein